jgi:hypothetical protein
MPTGPWTTVAVALGLAVVAACVSVAARTAKAAANARISRPSPSSGSRNAAIRRPGPAVTVPGPARLPPAAAPTATRTPHSFEKLAEAQSIRWAAIGRRMYPAGLCEPVGEGIEDVPAAARANSPAGATGHRCDQIDRTSAAGSCSTGDDRQIPIISSCLASTGDRSCCCAASGACCCATVRICAGSWPLCSA